GLVLDDRRWVLVGAGDSSAARANAIVPAEGAVVEDRGDGSRGPVATLLVQNGTLNMRDVVVAGTTWGRVKAMFDDRGKRIRKAGPGNPADIMGLMEEPQAGDTFMTTTAQ